MDLSPILQFFTANKDLIGFVFGSGALLAIGNNAWWFRQQQRKQLVSLDQFPFEVFKPNEVTLQRLMGEGRTDELADHKIPYLQRVAGRNIGRELRQGLDDRGWVLILGRSGLGKTREAAEIAERMSRQGWTVLKLKSQGWLEAPNELPEDRLGTNRQILFFLDDLHLQMEQGRDRKSPKVDDPMQPAIIPLQERLLRTLEAYERFVGADRFRVLAIARNEQDSPTPGKLSEFDKLAWSKYPQLWQRFEAYEMAEVEDQTIIQLFEQITPNIEGIQATPENFPALARKNDRTFKTVVLNLQKTKDLSLPLTPQNYQGTVRGSWEKRYQEVVKRHKGAQPIYDAVDLLRSLNVDLKEFVVVPTAHLMVGGTWRQWQWKWRIRQALPYLIRTEGILDPRDGQIEGKGYAVEVGERIPRLARLLLQLSQRQPGEMVFLLRDFAFALYGLERYQQSLSCLNRVLEIVHSLEQLTLKSDADLEEAQWAKDFLFITFGVQGNVLYFLNRYQESVASYDKAIEFKSDSHEAWSNRGLSLANLQKYDEAIASYDKAIEFKSDSHEAWSNRGISLANLQKYDEAIASYDKAIEFKSDSHEAWSNRGISLANLQRYDEAIASYDKAIEFKSDDHEAWSNRGISLANLQKYDEAIASYDKAIEFKSDYHEAWYNRGISLANLQRYDEAIASYDKATEFKSDSHEAWSNRGISLDNLQKHDEAIASYDKATEFKSDSHEAWSNRGISLANLQRYDEAIASYDKAIEFKSDSHEAWSNRGISLANLQRYDEAIASYDKATEFKSDSHEAWSNRGISLANLQRYDEAIASYDKAIEFKSDDHEAWSNRGISLANLQRYDEAIASYDKAIEFKSDYHAAWFNRGLILQILGRYDDAIISYDRVLKIEPEDSFTLYNKAKCYAPQNNVALAIESLAQAIALDPRAREKAKSDADFDTIRGNALFQALLESPP